jgi:RluA family pseudouridine synthase
MNRSPHGFDLLYEDGPCLAVSKPGGLLTQAPPGIDSLEARVKAFLHEREQPPGNLYLGLPHRLDRPATGILVMARNVRATRRICDQFQDRTVEKCYRALVAGHVTPEKGVWRDPMRKIPDVAGAEIVDERHPDAKHAVLRYRVLLKNEGSSLLEIRLETGRTHQIRLQAGSRGHPIWGDAQYGSTIPFGPQTEIERDRWIALHAQSLAWTHPKSKERVTVTAPLPDAWRDVIEANDEDL